MQYCTRCVYPAAAATPLTFDEDGVCSGCRVGAQKAEINWELRWQAFGELAAEYQSTDDYDIVIPVSGGKDSYYQTHVAVRELGLKPLLVTYHGNNYLPEGEYNLYRMREVFDCDHVIVRPSVKTLVKMNRIGFRLQGDMNWHAHCGIFTVPIKVAVRYRVPLILWGEHGFADLGGMYSMSDFVEFTAKHRLEHALRGFDWHDFTDEGLERLGRPELREGLTAKDLLWAQYPSDDELVDVGVRGIYLGNYVDWDANEHVRLVLREYDWRPAQQPFERTYRLFSNLDDMHENGIHDYLKFVKLGYGRASDHACKDIRAGIMSRDEGIEMVRRYDHVKPRRDLERWLEYVGMNEDEFDHVCDTFRNPRVWRIKDGEWVKDNVWGEPSSYGPVHRCSDACATAGLEPILPERFARLTRQE
jgi:N-acetyl sugar amidotransferase